MKTTVNMQRRAARAMKRAVQHGVDPRDTASTFAKVYKRLWVDDARRRPWTISDAYVSYMDKLD